MSSRYTSLPDSLVVSSDGPVRLITLNRPDQFNAADDALHSALAEVWDLIAADDSASVAVLTGAGRAFSAGGDFDRMQETHEDEGVQDEVFSQARRMIHGMIHLPIPLIAAINGPAVGLGASLATLCDLGVMAEDTFLADPHVSVGLVAGDGAAMAWPLFMSLARAKEYAFTGDRIPAVEALRLGLVNRIVPREEVLETSLALAFRLAALPAAALRDTKKMLNMHLSRALTEIIDFGLDAERRSVASADHRAIIARLAASSVGVPGSNGGS